MGAVGVSVVVGGPICCVDHEGNSLKFTWEGEVVSVQMCLAFSGR